MLELLMLNTGQLLLNTVTVLACHVQVEGPGSFLIVHVTAQTAADVRELLIMALTGEPVLYGRAVAQSCCSLILAIFKAFTLSPSSSKLPPYPPLPPCSWPHCRSCVPSPCCVYLLVLANLPEVCSHYLFL